MKCYLCKSKNILKKEGSLRDIVGIHIFECIECGLVFLDKQVTDDNYYKNSGMIKSFKESVASLTGGFNVKEKDIERNILHIKSICNIKNSNILDFGSGYGDFLIELKNNSPKYIAGIEIEDNVKKIYKDYNIDLFNDISEVDDNYFDIVTLFHCLAHIRNPIELLGKIIKKIKKGGKIIIETPNANDALVSLYKNRGFLNFTYQMCMLYYFTDNNLRYMAKYLDLDIDFIRFIQRYPISNTMYWLNNNLPSGQSKWGGILDNDNLQNAYENTLAKAGITDTLFIQFSKR